MTKIQTNPHVVISKENDVPILEPGSNCPVLFFAQSQVHALLSTPEAASALVIVDVGAAAIETVLAAGATFEAKIVEDESSVIESAVLKFRLPNGLVVAYVSDEAVANSRERLKELGVDLAVTGGSVNWDRQQAKLIARSFRASQRCLSKLSGYTNSTPNTWLSSYARHLRTRRSKTTQKTNPMRLFYSPDPVRIFGHHDYASIVGGSVYLPQLLTVRRLLEIYTDDFNQVSQLLTKEQWRHLYQIHGYTIFALENPGFDPISEIWSLMHDEEVIALFVEELVGPGTDPHELASSIRQQIDGLTADQSKALWALLFVGRCLSPRYRGLTDEPTESARWWDLPTLRGMLRQLPSWSVKQLERPRSATAKTEELL